MVEGEPLASYARRYEGLDRFFLDGPRFRHHIETAFGPLAELFGGRAAEEFAAMELDAKAELIKGLIPLGLMAVASPPLRQQRATARQESKSFQQRSS